MEPLSSSGWSVRPSFVPHGPTAPVTLLFGEDGLTQLAGVYPVAWQTPWSELGDLALTRSGSSLTFAASVGGVRYEWRRRGLDEFEELRELVLARGGAVQRRRRRSGAVVIAVVVLIASMGGVIASLLSGGSGIDTEVAEAKLANLGVSDLPVGWSTLQAGYLSYLVPAAGQVITSTSTTTPAVDVVAPVVTAQFQRCLGISNAKDRIFGAAGQLPDVQVSSPIFHTLVPVETEVATTAQYYRTTGMVRRDIAEMSRANFGACFAAANATVLLSQYASQVTASRDGTNWQPVTFAKGWARGGQVSVDLPGVTTAYSLVVAVVAGGHFEVTLSALVPSSAANYRLLDQLVGTLKTRIDDGGGGAAV